MYEIDRLYDEVHDYYLNFDENDFRCENIYIRQGYEQGLEAALDIIKNFQTSSIKE